MPVKHSLYWYDRPMLFTGESQGQSYLGLVIDETDDNDDVILLSLCSRKRRIDISRSLVTPRQAQKFPDSSRLVRLSQHLYLLAKYFKTTWKNIEDPTLWTPLESLPAEDVFLGGYGWWRTRDEKKQKLNARRKYKQRHAAARS